jgi:hypothetical protein
MAALGDQPRRLANTDSVIWGFTLPSPYAMASAVLWRAGDASAGALGASYEFGIASPSETSVIDECVVGLGCTRKGESTPFAAVNRVVVPTGDLGSRVYVRAGCGGGSEYECPSGQGDANSYAAVIYLYAADLAFGDSDGKSIGAAPSGGVVTSATK